MTSFGHYHRSKDEDDGVIHDQVKMEIQADSEEEKLECLHDLSVIHEVLEELGIFKNVSE